MIFFKSKKQKEKEVVIEKIIEIAKRTPFSVDDILRFTELVANCASCESLRFEQILYNTLKENGMFKDGPEL